MDGWKVPMSEWEGALADLQADEVPEAMRRVLDPAQIRAYDTSRVGRDVLDDTTDVESVSTATGEGAPEWRAEYGAAGDRRHSPE